MRRFICVVFGLLLVGGCVNSPVSIFSDCQPCPPENPEIKVGAESESEKPATKAKKDRIEIDKKATTLKPSVAPSIEVSPLDAERERLRRLAKSLREQGERAQSEEVAESLRQLFWGEKAPEPDDK